MFGRTIDPRERQDVLELLGRWPRALARIDEASDAMRFTMVEQPMGMRSEEYEEARLAAIEVLRQVRAEISSPRFWPILKDNVGAITMLELQKKLDECLAHQLNLLNLYGQAASAFRRGRQDQSPSHKDVMSANRSFARALDQMGPIGGKLARRYRISLQELQRELRHRGIGSKRTSAQPTPPTIAPLADVPNPGDPIVFDAEEEQAIQRSLATFFSMSKLEDRPLSEEQSEVLETTATLIALDELARRRIDQGELSEAASTCIKIIGVGGSKNPTPFLLLARAHAEHGDYARASAIIDGAQRDMRKHGWNPEFPVFAREIEQIRLLIQVGGSHRR